MVAVAIGYRLDVQDKYSDFECDEAHDVRYMREVVKCEWSMKKAKQKSIPHRRDCRDPSSQPRPYFGAVPCLKHSTRCSVSNQEEVRVIEPVQLLIVRHVDDERYASNSSSQID